MNTKDQIRIINQLSDIVKNEHGTIRACVAQEALDYSAEDIMAFFKDLLSHGCISGMVNSLIYYADTAIFFDRHYVEIENLRFEHLENGGEPLQFDGDLKNAMAWFAFEETARQLVDELKIDL